MFGILPATLYTWYRNHLSDYLSDKSSGKYPAKFIETLHEKSGEIVEKPLPIFNPKNIGEEMSIDDKAIGNEGYTILSNRKTNKIAMMIESTKKEELETAIDLFGEKLVKIKSISMDMSPTYLSVCAKRCCLHR
jgi:hypothetical protein